MSRHAAVNTAALRGARPLSPRARITLAALLLAVILGVGLAVQPPAARATTTSHPVRIVPPSGGVNNLVIAGHTFSDVSDDLTVGGEAFDIPLDLAAVGTSNLFTVNVTATPATLTVTLIASGVTPFNLPPLSGLTVDVMLLAVWDDGADLDPNIVLAIRSNSGNLSQLFPGWAAIPVLSDLLGFSEAVLLLTPTPGFTLNPAVLPVEVNDFLGLGGTLDGELVLDSATRLLADAVPPIGDSLRFTVDEVAGATMAIVNIEGSVPIAAVLSQIGTDAFAGANFGGQLNFPNADLEEIEFSFDDSDAETVLGLRAVVTGLALLGADNLRAQILIGLDKNDGEDAVFLGALRIDDEDCDDCIEIHQLLNVPNFSLDANFTLPAANFAVVVPDGADFSASKLGANAKALLDEVNGSPTTTPYTVVGDVNFMADVPIDGLSPLLGQLGITTTGSVHLEGRAGLTLPFFDDVPNSGTLDNFHVEATLAGINGSSPDPNGFPTAWLTMPDTGEWKLFLDFAEGGPGDTDDTIEVGASVAGVDVDNALFGDIPPFTLSAVFSGQVSGGTEDWTIVASAVLDDQWTAPFGIGFLTVQNASAVLTIDHPADEPLTAKGELCGTFNLSGVVTTVCFSISNAAGAQATFRISLDQPVSLQQVIGLLGMGITLPTSVGSASLNGELDFSVNGLSVFSINAVVTATFNPFGNPVGIDLMLSANFGGGPTTVAVGVQPHAGITLGDVLNLPLPVDLPLTPEDPGNPGHALPNSGFAFVYTSAEFDLDAPGLPQIVLDWFSPLYAGDPSGKTLPSGPSILGAFALPEPIGGFVSNLGMDPNVLVSGGLTLENPPSVNLDITLRLRDGLLPEFIDGVELTLGISLETAPPALEFRLDGFMYLKFKQGVDPEIAEPLQNIGINLPIAAAVTSDFECPRGGHNLVALVEDGDQNAANDQTANFCYDRIRLNLGTALSVTVEPTPKVSLLVYGGMLSQNFEAAAPDVPVPWSPLGIEEIGIAALGAEIEISFEPAPLALSIKLGLYGDIRLFDYDVSAGVKVGVTVVAAPTPIGVAVTPNFDGFRISLPDGLESAAIIDLANLLADAVGVAHVPEPGGGFPNIALKNLYFSISPVGAPTVCIEQGLIFRGDLYIDPDPDLNFIGAPACDPSDGPPAAGYPIDPDESCEEMQDQGCFASVVFSLTPNGLIADGFIGGFDIEPLEMHFQGASLNLRLTLQDQFIRIRGGVWIGGTQQNPNAIGTMALELQPGNLVFAGQLKAFGFNALVSGEASANPLDLLTGGDIFLELHVFLAAPELALPEYGSTFPDFSERIRSDLERTVDDVAEVLAFIQDTVEDFNAHPFTTLGGLPDRLSDEGYPDITPDWVDDFLGQLAILDALLVGDGRDEGGYSTEDLVNGFELGGVHGVYIWCDGVIDDEGKCWGFVNNPPICTGIEIDGECWLLPPFEWEGFCGADFIPAVIKDEDPGPNCQKEEFAAFLETTLGGLVTNLAAFAGFPDPQEVIDTANQWLNAGSGVTLFGLQCASLDVLISAFGESNFEIAFDATLLDNDLELGFGWEFDHPLRSAGRFLASLIQGSDGEVCPLPDQALFGAGGLGNPESYAEEGEEELPPLSVNISAGPASVFEGASVTAVVTLNRDVALEDGAVSVTIDWGDGSADSVVVFAEGDSSSGPVSHTYADDNPTATPSDATTITATMAAPDHSSDSTVVTVKNRAPANLQLNLSQASINEGGEAELTVEWTDAGTGDTHSVRVNWGDGTIQIFPNAHGGDAFTHTYLDDKPSGTASDNVFISVRVRDDDTGIVKGTTELTVNNVPPVATSIQISPPTVDEGDSQEFTFTWTDVGLLDSHTVSIDWNNDGVFDESWQAGSDRSLTVSHMFVDDHPATGTPWDDLTVRVKVLDDDTGLAESNETIRVNNVAPTLCIVVDPGALDPEKGSDCPAISWTINEGGAITVRGVFHDPGVLDTHTVEIDWGFAGFDDTILTFLPDEPLPENGGHAFSATQVYGDNGTFTITVTVRDDDTGTDVSTASITVDNVNPDVALDESAASSAASGGTIPADGPDDDGVLSEPTFVVRQGASLTLGANATDPGSDDLAFTWDWDAGSLDPGTTETLSRVNPPVDDPTPSPTVQPRSLFTTASHTWTQACLYNVGLRVRDDDGGIDNDNTWVVVTGTATKIDAPGYWYNQYDTSKSNKNSLSTLTLDCYLKVVRHMSRVFNTLAVVNSFTEARQVLNQRPLGNDKEIMVRQLLGAWLNFANGSVGWFTMVDTNGDRVVDKQFGQLMLESEALRMNPAATRAQLLAQEQMLKVANGD